jgi:hypothetical protein
MVGWIRIRIHEGKKVSQKKCRMFSFGSRRLLLKLGRPSATSDEKNMFFFLLVKFTIFGNHRNGLNMLNPDPQ